MDAKLSSLPGVDDVRFEVSPLSVILEPSRDSGPQEDKVTAENILTVVKDPRYASYAQMVQVGVPVGAVRHGMLSAGLSQARAEGESGRTAGQSSDSGKPALCERARTLTLHHENIKRSQAHHHSLC